jgi:FAD/FMN-containing dehydrogenase
VTQVTLKLKPLPECVAWFGQGWKADNIGTVLDSFCKSQARPTCLDLINPATIQCVPSVRDFHGSPSWVLFCCYEGNRESVNWQANQFMDVSRSLEGRDTEVASVYASQNTIKHYHYHGSLESQVQAKVTFRANVLPSALADFCMFASGLSSGILLQAHAGNGIAVGLLRGDLTLDQAKAMLTPLLERAVAAQGNLVIARCPTEWKRELPIWGRPRGDWALMRRVKQAFDPRGVFNPGRFVDGM